MDSDLTNENTERDQENYVNAYALDMDITENMASFKDKVAEGLSLDLSNASVWVLSQKRLSDFETLQELCGSYAGTVQIQFFIAFNEDSGEQKIDILDVLKPCEETSDSQNQEQDSENITDDQPNKKLKTSKWIASKEFKEIQRKYSIPKNPALWSPSHVERWLSWAETEFKLKNLNPQNLKLNGRALYAMKVDQFRQLVPYDPEDIFYMHFELLRKTCIVAVLHNSVSSEDLPSSSGGSKENGEKIPLPPSMDLERSHASTEDIVRLPTHRNASSAQPTPSSALPVDYMALVPSTPDIPLSYTELPSSPVSSAAPSTSQPIQLWQFLLKLLTDPESTEIISWCGEKGEFKFHQPDLVAKLWGEQKGKTNMNYDKLSRSLRYYYDADNKMINKVNGKKYVYKFELDLRNVLGYDSSEIQEQICYAKKANST